MKFESLIPVIYSTAMITGAPHFQIITIMMEEEGRLCEHRPEAYVIPVVLLVILLIGITGNAMLLFIILRHHKMKTVSNIYVSSLALGDALAIVMCTLFTLTNYVVESWPFGVTLCKVSEYAKEVFVGASIFTLTTLSLARAHAVIDPLRNLRATGTRRHSKRFAVTLTVSIWILASMCAFPAFFSDVREFKVNGNASFHACHLISEEFGPKIIVVYRFLTYYVTPAVIITVSYMSMIKRLRNSVRNIPGQIQGQVQQVEARNKITRIAIAFVAVFAVCCLPQHVFMLWYHINPTAKTDYNIFWYYFRSFSVCLSFINTCTHPIAMYYVSHSFRKYFDRYLLCHMPRIRRQHHRSSMHSSRGRGRNIPLMSYTRHGSTSRIKWSPDSNESSHWGFLDVALCARHEDRTKGDAARLLTFRIVQGTMSTRNVFKRLR